jgi:uncharacterized secreted protein with C-terminal beta-propeller domain
MTRRKIKVISKLVSILLITLAFGINVQASEQVRPHMKQEMNMHKEMYQNQTKEVVYTADNATSTLTVIMACMASLAIVGSITVKDKHDKSDKSIEGKDETCTNRG